MKRILPFVIDLFVFFGIILLFQSHTNQKNFRIDIIGLGLFSFVAYSSFYWRSVKNNPAHFSTLLLVILLVCFVFLKIAEYDPIQIFPQKLGIKLIASSWIVFLLISFHKLSKEHFNHLAPFLAIVPVISFIDFMAYPTVPISMALIISYRNLKYDNQKNIFFTFVLLILAILVIGRDWWDDFALQRGILLFQAFLFFNIVKNWERNQLINFLRANLLFFLINSFFIFWGIGKDPNFNIFSYHEEVYLIPVSLLASNSLLMIMISVLLWLEPNQNKLFKGIYFLVSLTSVLWFGITVSRNSILSFFIFLILIFFGNQKAKYRKLIPYFLTFLVILFSSYVLFYSEKSILSLGSSAVRLSIWKYYLSSTIETHPFFGFGMYPENKLAFVVTKEFDNHSLNYIKDYIHNFASFPLAHNLYVQIFSSFGLVGSFILIGFIIHNILKNRILYTKGFKNNAALSIILIIWSLHEFYDFNSMEISNLFVLASISAFFVNSNNVSKIIDSNIKMYQSKIFLIFSILLLVLISFRFGFTDHYTLKYAKLVIPDNFEFYLSKDEKSFPYSGNLPEISLSEYRLLGNKFFFYNFAAQKNTESKLKHLEYCFNLQKHPAICYSKLIQFQAENQYLSYLIPYFQFFLKLYDPFDIYQRDVQ